MGTRRAISAMGLSGTATLLAVAGGATWYYAARLVEPPGVRRAPVAPDDHVEIVAGDETTLTLHGPDAGRPGWWGVAGAEGYARVGPPLEADGVHAVRPVELRAGALAPGHRAVLDTDAAPRDPRALPGVGALASEVLIDGPVGALPCWRFPGEGRTWAVLVHGRSGARQETFRLVPTMLAAGLPVLAVSYRNDPDGPPSPDRRSHLGATEWEDVAAAVRWAVDRGAQDVVLVGLSMGAACAAELLARSPLAAAVRALVLDAPVLDWEPVIQHAARERGLPGAVLPLLLPPTMALAGRRTRIDWRGLRHLYDPSAFDLPTLLFHGGRDAVVPVELGDAFAAARSDVVTYLRVEDAGHLQSWNLRRTRYERELRTFLERTGASAR